MTIAFTFDGQRVEAHEGDTIAAALTRADIVKLGSRRNGTARGVFCGMGVCQECIVTVDATPSLRACMECPAQGMVVTSQGYRASLPESTLPTPRPHSLERPQVLVVGAGAAGLAAARSAASCGARVTIVDERSSPGGQFYKQRAQGREAIDAKMRAGRELIGQVIALGVTLHRDAEVLGAFGPQEIGVVIAGELRVFAPERLVLATGAYERGVPVPGWTLPGFMTTGAAQSTWRTSGVAPGRRIVIAGNGPLNFELAAELIAAGIEVVALVEAAGKPRVGVDFWRAVCAAPRLMRDGFAYVRRLGRAKVPVLFQSAVVAAHGSNRIEACTVARLDGSEGSRRFAVDAVCAGYGFVCSNELARGLGCRHAVDADGQLRTIVDGDGQTTLEGVYAIGDGATFRGAHVALSQGYLTGCAIARSLGLSLPPLITRELAENRRTLARHLAFQDALWRMFAAPALHASFTARDTLVCRCEAVTRQDIDDAISRGAASLGVVKRRTRAGMGRCQGRYCQSVIAALCSRDAETRDELSGWSPRVPVRSVRVRDLT